MAGKAKFSLNYFLIMILLVFFMLLYVYLGGPSKTPLERFTTTTNYQLIPADKMVVMQGLFDPNAEYVPAIPDSTDPSSPPVDGTEQGPRSKFFFAFNECKPECCATSSGYSCNGGCPCLTTEQHSFAGSRGQNQKGEKCGFDGDKVM